MNQIKQFRKEKGMTQKEFALHTGIPVRIISDHEVNDTPLRRNNQLKIVMAFGHDFQMTRYTITRISKPEL